jgi:hypothetical protein
MDKSNGKVVPSDSYPDGGPGTVWSAHVFISNGKDVPSDSYDPDGGRVTVRWTVRFKGVTYTFEHREEYENLLEWATQEQD